MSKLKKWWPALLALVLALGCAWYLTDHYPAFDSALQVLTEEGVTVSGRYTLLEPEAPGTAGILFYPGAKVAEEAYLPLLDQLRDAGYTCLLVEMPFRMAIFDQDAAKEAMAAAPGVTDWYIAGHSMGGAMASAYASKNPEAVRGLILLGSYPYGDYPLERTLTVYGSLNTSVAEEVDYTENLLVIEGGNHANFGDYGPQAGDPPAAIPAKEQQAITAAAIHAFIAGQAS